MALKQIYIVTVENTAIPHFVFIFMLILIIVFKQIMDFVVNLYSKMYCQATEQITECLLFHFCFSN